MDQSTIKNISPKVFAIAIEFIYSSDCNITKLTIKGNLSKKTFVHKIDVKNK